MTVFFLFLSKKRKVVEVDVECCNTPNLIQCLLSLMYDSQPPVRLTPHKYC